MGSYTWNQSLGDLDILAPLADTSRRDIDVNVRRSSIRVCVGESVLLDGTLTKPVDAESSTWTLSNGELEIHLEKENEGWWDSVVLGGDKIDTTKLDPETSRLSDLDPESRATVEKMMWDNRQRQAGLPTSDEQRQMNVMNKMTEKGSPQDR